jgi:glutamine synthetase
MARTTGFIEKHGLWSSEQRRRAKEITARIKKEKLKLFRVAWADPHGASRAKTVTVPAFVDALENGYNINVATTTLDASGARTFASFTRGGGMGLDEMTGSPNLIIVPDPMTFRVLPWEPNVGWILCDEYFVSGKPFYFSPRHLLRKQVDRLAKQGMECRIGLEVEWYLLKLAERELTLENIGAPGFKGRAPNVYPVEPGYSLHSETNLDAMQTPLSAVADALEKLGLPLRSFENEWGPGQVECTFGPRPALKAADNLVLFRTATRQICRRLGYLATFMCRPALKGFYSSGWHLHQSLASRKTGLNLFTPKSSSETLSPLGKYYLGGLLHHALASTVLSNPTVNAYRRFRTNSLAPDRAAWGFDHRGAMLRVLGGANDPATRIENRAGEPSANPYLYIASQVVTGLDGIEHRRDPGSPQTDPYTSQCPMLPKRLSDALTLFDQDTLFREQFGKTFVDYYVRIKRTELERYESYIKDNGIDPAGEIATAWEQDEYLDFF